ncbi:sensor histidine kinase [Marihabitans asiaticum]|uniref:histidine kinase n=1 Tax=Marihabitans asiaticum TaxID=415218 RepID=A0A560WGZ0_9MICO|nr:sensor histidine kinase [Marihabitans asiaticum]TWD16764.1 signal transduction histidine kinase [Marihabitans asiaticum]
MSSPALPVGGRPTPETAGAQAPVSSTGSVPGQPRAGILRRWTKGWGDLALLLTHTVTAWFALGAWLLLLGAIAAISGVIGIVLIIPALWLCRVLGVAERHRVSALTGAQIAAPTPPVGQPLWQRLWLDKDSWRAAAYLVLHSMWGLAIGFTMLVAAAFALTLVALPLYAGSIPDDGLSLWLVRVDGLAELTALWLVGVLALLALPLLSSLVTQVDVRLARWLLGRDETQVMRALSDRVDTLTSTRQETVDSVESERRRIERDLHDGPQQRLVAIAMSLGMARDAIRSDPDAASELLDEAHASAKEAIVEMRHVARGIAPPVLTDRGLDAALSALASRSPIPVEVRADGVGRVDPTVEAIAYFVASEGLTNVAKHSRACRAMVDVMTSHGEQPALIVRVTDDGVGGADPSLGTGLTGLRQRVRSVDGELEVSSPPGGPTTLTATLPLRTDRSQS